MSPTGTRAAAPWKWWTLMADLEEVRVFAASRRMVSTASVNSGTDRVRSAQGRPGSPKVSRPARRSS
ncbi:MAG TPA: hypothetical protein VFN91_15030 [Myxococcaceae bacterium]|nr:hypothetical protein [Myxococcaceae bacterium]